MALFQNAVIHKVQAVADWESYNHSAFTPRPDPDSDTDAAREVNTNSIVIPRLGVGVESQHI